MASVFRLGVKLIGRNLPLTHTAAIPALPDGSPRKCQYLAITAAEQASWFPPTPRTVTFSIGAFSRKSRAGFSKMSSSIFFFFRKSNFSACDAFWEANFLKQFF
jgi:hypothetical protein